MRSLGLALCMAVLLALGTRATGMPTAGDPPSPESQASALSSATGAQYLAQRDAALQLPQPEFELLLLQLKRDGASPKELVVAWAIELRRTQPETAASFDAAAAESLANATQDRAGRWRYKGQHPIDAVMDPLVFEWLLKRSDVREEARWRFNLRVDRRFRGGSRMQTAVLALADEPGAPQVELLHAAILQGGSSLDQRVLDLIVRAYHSARGEAGAPNATAGALADILGASADPKVGQVLRSLIQEERDLAAAAGKAPWQDTRAIAKESYSEAVRVRSQMKANHAAGQVALSPSDIEQLDAHVSAARERLEFRQHWEALERSAAAVAKATNPEP